MDPAFIQYPAITLCLAFGMLALIHFYWALGGRRGFDAALPRNGLGERLFTPGPAECAAVGLGLLVFACLYFLKRNPDFTWWLPRYGGWFVVALFFGRAIGDFRYIGFFKRIRGSDFSRLDSRYYSPLCLLLSGLALTIELTPLFG